MESANGKTNLTYSALKDSGIPWLVKIPDTWILKRAKFIFTRMNRPVREDDDIVTAFRDGNVTLRINRRIEGFTNSLKEIGYQGVRKGDLVIHGMDGFAGAIGVSDSDGKATPVYSVCRPARTDEADNYYYAYLLRHMALTGYIQSLARGIRERSTEFRYNEFAEQWLPLPLFDEQCTIVTFLDRETARIDALVAKKERLIKLLEEKRATLISRAVTKGLDPNVPMKDSGIELIGLIPSDWCIKRLRFLCHVNPSKSEVRQLPRDTEVTFLPMKMISECADVSMDETRQLKEVWEGYTYARDGDVIVAMITPCFENGKGALLKGLTNCIAFGTTELHVLRSGDSILPEFLYLLTRTHQFRSLGVASMRGVAGQQRVTEDYVKDYIVPLPSLQEQQAIVTFLGRETSNIDMITLKIRQQIGKLHEYRTAIISLAVTGKIDVRRGEA